MNKDPIYPQNPAHAADIKLCIQNLSSYPFFENVAFDYSRKSINDMEDALQVAFLHKGFNPIKDLNYGMNRSIAIYIGEVYIHNNSGTWLSYHPDKVIPYGIKVGEKISYRGFLLTHDILYEYPYENYESTTEKRFQLNLIYEYIEDDFI